MYSRQACVQYIARDATELNELPDLRQRVFVKLHLQTNKLLLVYEIVSHLFEVSDRQRGS